jgi:hypothetical protein
MAYAFNLTLNPSPVRSHRRYERDLYPSLREKGRDEVAFVPTDTVRVTIPPNHLMQRTPHESRP